MPMSKHHQKNSTVIIGGGLAGLTLAALLEDAGHDYLLLEGQTEFGGLAKGQQEQGVWLDYGMKTIPSGAEISANPLLVLKKKLNFDFQIESWTDSPQTLDKKGLVPFMGFGETKVRDLVDELSYFTSSPRLLVSGGWAKLTDCLLARIPESKRLTRAIVSRIDIDDRRVTAVHINGESMIETDRVISTLAPAHLKSLVAVGKLPVKLALKLSKISPWTALSLDIATGTRETDAKNIFILKDAVEDDFYILGHFVSNADPSRNVSGLQISSWLTLIDAEKAIDDEFVSKAIKTMKKNIKRVFPKLAEEAKWERILVAPDAIAQSDEITFEKSGALIGFDNLYLAGAHIGGSSRNLSNALQSALNLAERLVNAKSNIAQVSSSAPVHDANQI
jgi:phytoene dehydrogenase-like protein